MQLTPEDFFHHATTAVEKSVKTDPSIVAAYLCGSAVLGGNPLLGGTTDIDIVFVHNRSPHTPREFQPLTEQVHLDIQHHLQDDYRQGRELRVHPWMGPTLMNAKPLYDPRHFIDFTQASVRGLFHRPENHLKRARPLAGQARQAWILLNATETEASPERILDYLQAIADAANAVALLTGEPLTERRILLEFPERTAAVARPGMAIGLVGLLGGGRVEAAMLKSWLPGWNATIEAIPVENLPLSLHPYRRKYFLNAFEAFIDGNQAQAILWPLFNTWTLAASKLPASDSGFQTWRDACQRLGIAGAEFRERVAALDAFLEQVEDALYEWEQVHGI